MKKSLVVFQDVWFAAFSARAAPSLLPRLKLPIASCVAETSGEHADGAP